MNNEKFKKLLREFIESRGENLFNEGRGRHGGRRPYYLGQEPLPKPVKDAEWKAATWEKEQARAQGMTLPDFQAKKKAAAHAAAAAAQAKAEAEAQAKADAEEGRWGTIQGCCGGADTEIYNIIVYDSNHARASAIRRGVHKLEVLEMVKKAAFGQAGFLNKYLNGKLIVGDGDDAKFAIKAVVNRSDGRAVIWAIARYYPTSQSAGKFAFVDDGPSVGVVTVYNEKYAGGKTFSTSEGQKTFNVGEINSSVQSKIPGLLQWGSIDRGEKPKKMVDGHWVEIPEDEYLRGEKK